MFGGGMRQAGIIAAGALYALENHRARLADDHSNAKRLAQALAELPAIRIDLDRVQTNIVFFDVTTVSAQQFADKLRHHQVLINPAGPTTLRAVTHLDVSTQQINQALDAVRQVLS